MHRGLPVLIGVPSHDIEAALEGRDVLGIVGIEVQQEAALLLLVAVVGPALEHVGLPSTLQRVALPAQRGVLGDDDRALTRGVVVAEVKVEAELGEEVELVFLLLHQLLLILS